jgi:hypothetical protein
MTAYSTKGLNVYLARSTATLVTLTTTAISKAKPAVVTVASTTGVTAGDVVKPENTGFTEIDGKTFTVGTVTSTTLVLTGSDTTGSLNSLGATPSVKITKKSDMVRLCLSELTIDPSSTNQIDAGTFCTDQTILGKTTLGGISVSGYLDPSDAGLDELIKADDDGLTRAFKIELPSTALGSLVGAVTIAGFSPSTPIEGAIAFTATGNQSDKIRWVHP